MNERVQIDMNKIIERSLVRSTVAVLTKPNPLMDGYRFTPPKKRSRSSRARAEIVSRVTLAWRALCGADLVDRDDLF